MTRIKFVYQKHNSCDKNISETRSFWEEYNFWLSKKLTLTATSLMLRNKIPPPNGNPFKIPDNRTKFLSIKQNSCYRNKILLINAKINPDDSAKYQISNGALQAKLSVQISGWHKMQNIIPPCTRATQSHCKQSIWMYTILQGHS